MHPGPFRLGSAIVLSMITLFAGCTKSPLKAAVSTPAITTTVEIPTDLEREAKLYQLQMDGKPVSLKVIHFKDSRFPPELLYEAGNPSVPCNLAQANADPFEPFRLLFQHVLKATTSEPQYSLYLSCYPEVDARMTALAAADPHWQTLEREKSPPSIVYSFLGKLLITEGVASELNHALALSGYTAQVDPHSLEKLWTTSPAQLTPQQTIFVRGALWGTAALPTQISKAFILTRRRG